MGYLPESHVDNRQYHPADSIHGLPGSQPEASNLADAMPQVLSTLCFVPHPWHLCCA